MKGCFPSVFLNRMSNIQTHLGAEERLSLLFKVTLLHEKVHFHLSVTYNFFSICDHFVYTENIAYAQAGFFRWPITLKLVWFFESHKRTLGYDY